MAKYEKKNNDTKTTVIVIAFAVLLVVAITALVFLLPRGGDRQEEPTTLTDPTTQTETSTQTEPTTAPTEPTEQPTEPSEEDALIAEIPGFTRIEDVSNEFLNEQPFIVVCAGKYSGPFYEDKSDENVTDVLAIVVKNNTEDDWVENADLELSCDGKTAKFTVSSLPAQRYALLLELNRMTYTDGMEFSSPVCTFCTTDMSGKKLDYLEDFYPEPYISTIQDGKTGDFIMLHNISGHDISSDVEIYYKNVVPCGPNGTLVYMGGITYMHPFDGPITVNNPPQARLPYYSAGGSSIQFMIYEP